MIRKTSLALACFVAWGGFAGGYLHGSLPEVPSYEQTQRSYRTSELFLLDREGKPLHQWRQNSHERSFSWVSLREVSPAFIEALLKSEDKNFFNHAGVDVSALGASVYQRFFRDSPRGGSTLSMQLLKLLHENKALYQGWVGKLRQILAVSRLESSWTKSQILEAYFNLAPFRGEHLGLASASWSLFDKMPSGLTLKESTLLAVLIRSPNANGQEWSERACWQEPSFCEDFKVLSKELVNKRLNPLIDQRALHLAQRLSKTGLTGSLRTSLDRSLQIYTQELVQTQIRSLESQNVHEAAVLVIENQTGEVWAYVTGTSQEKNRYVDGVQAFRQAGSTLKPFLYATAFEKNILHANSWIEDSAVDIVFDRGIYKPQNHDRQFYGWIPVKTALASSLNVPAVKVFKLLNDDSFWGKLKELNFQNLRDPDYYGPALALGVADVTLEDLTQGYRALALNGKYSALRFQEEASPPQFRQVFSEQSAQEVAQILSEGQNRSLGFGLDSSLSLSGTSVKTGTSKDMRDNWCVGFNEKFTVGVWVGNFSGEPMWNVMGITGAAPIWKKVMERLQERFPVKMPARDLLASSPGEVNPETYPQARVLYPQDGMILALDPAIPEEHQRMPLLVEVPKSSGWSWQIDKKKKIAVQGPYLWTPTLGRHTFELYQEGKLMKTIQVLVK